MSVHIYCGWLQKYEGTGDESPDEDNMMLAAAGGSGQSRDNTRVVSDSDDDDAAVLAKPEFEGMWDTYKPYKPPKSDVPSGPPMPGASKMDRVGGV